MIILGIDPGTATTGFGCINITDISAVTGKGLQVIEWGLIETDKSLLKEERLEIIFERTLKLIERFKPDVFVFEKVFFSNNAKTVIAVGQAQGVMLLAARKLNVFVAEYAPGTIKKLSNMFLNLFFIGSARPCNHFFNCSRSVFCYSYTFFVSC